MIKTINDVLLLKLPYFPEENGELVVMEGLQSPPFQIARVFTVRAPKNALRGEHAHKRCTQFLTCPNGSIKVNCDDGINQKSYILNDPSMGLLIPPGIWAQQDYLTESAILTVLCDRPYEEIDYIRDYQSFLNINS